MASGIGMNIEIKGLDDLLERMEEFPRRLRRVLRRHMQDALDVIHEKIPGYPRKLDDQVYRRKGTLGGSLGTSMEGQKVGQPDIKRVRIVGTRAKGTFGSKLDYAQYVIGENQAEIHQGRWWTLKGVARDATDKIERRFEIMADEIARFLDKGV